MARIDGIGMETAPKVLELLPRPPNGSDELHYRWLVAAVAVAKFIKEESR